MSDKSVAIFAMALDGALHDYPRRTDLGMEIMKVLTIHRPIDFASMHAMAALSDGEIFGMPHLIRLRAKYMNKEMNNESD